jgi:hypothetical protein
MSSTRRQKPEHRRRHSIREGLKKLAELDTTGDKAATAQKG